MADTKIPINGQLVRRNDADFVLVDDTDLGGGYRVVQDIVARGAIPPSMLKVGMLVALQLPTLQIYQLISTTPITWVLFTGGGGGGGAQQVFNEVPGGSVDGSNVLFTTGAQFVPGTTRLYVNGVRQFISGDYVEGLDQQSIVFVSPPMTGWLLVIDYQLP